MTKKSFQIVKKTLIIASLTLLGIVSIIFINLYFDCFYDGFFYENHILCKISAFVIICAVTVLSVVFFNENKEFLYKLFSIFIIFIAVFTVFIYFLKISGITDKFNSVESFRKYIENYGSSAWILFITLQFLQVVVLPIPAFITVGAGTLLFGPFWGGVYSAIGIILGSLVAFFIGRKFGYNVAKWLVGKGNLDKGLNAIKGKDTVILTFMFLFPFFPDDVLCFVAGITSISPKFFTVMIIITRIISIFTSTYSMNNSLIPYNTWWGILIWAFIFLLTFLIIYLVIKNGEKIEKYFKLKFKKRK